MNLFKPISISFSPNTEKDDIRWLLNYFGNRGNGEEGRLMSNR